MGVVPSQTDVFLIIFRAVELEPPVKIPTPYGGRLEWTMPGDNKIVCHMKDKNKIRHRKRWSQIMYMYYLLGYKLVGRDTDFNGTLSSRTSSWTTDTTKTKGMCVHRELCDINPRFLLQTRKCCVILQTSRDQETDPLSNVTAWSHF